MNLISGMATALKTKKKLRKVQTTKRHRRRDTELNKKGRGANQPGEGETARDFKSAFH
jgi:hypothetical protein